jgi:hypothetical protein
MNFKFKVGDTAWDDVTKQQCVIVGISYCEGKIDPLIDSVGKEVYWTDLGHYPSNGRTQDQLHFI